MTLTISPLFTDNAVLQRGRPVTVWGRSTPGSRIAVTLCPDPTGNPNPTANPDPTPRPPAGDRPPESTTPTTSVRPTNTTSITEADGRWEVTLPARTAGGPFTLTVTSDTHVLTSHGLLFGDLWLAAGQSNMELTMSRVADMVPWEYARADQPLIRLFTAPPEVDFAGPRDDIANGGWLAATPATVGAFSAAAYFFAKRLVAETGVPIGLLSVAVGGSPIRAWTPREAGDYEKRLTELTTPGMIEQAEAHETALILAHTQARDEVDLGILQRWHEPDYDDHEWEVRRLGSPLDDAGSGAVWYRTQFDAPGNCGPAVVYLGAMVDKAQCWINGKLVGETTGRYEVLRFDLPDLPAGRVAIALRLLIDLGEGEITPGKLRLVHTRDRDWDLTAMPWRIRRGATTPNRPRLTPFMNEPTGLFNALIAPLSRLHLTGALWYQGESDTEAAKEYPTHFAAMANSWRKMWPDLPMIWVELAHWAPTPGARDTWGDMRLAQARCLALPHTAMVAGQDLGDAHDLHPGNKLMVGERLAWAALSMVYGKDLGFSPYVIRTQAE